MLSSIAQITGGQMMFQAWMRRQPPAWLLMTLFILAVLMEIQATYRMPGKSSPIRPTNESYVNLSEEGLVAFKGGKKVGHRRPIVTPVVNRIAEVFALSFLNLS
jgi:hypothetical protein